ncbi:MAG: hypothetical protein JJU21_03095 [Salinarimonas sp.]|nr:hypothetical protein [Salinarimonas sp.]
MATDLATLGLSVDSRQVRTATRDLDRMPRSARRAERGAQRLTRQTDQMSRSFQGAVGTLQRFIPVLGGLLTAQGLTRAAQNAVSAFAELER